MHPIAKNLEKCKKKRFLEQYAKYLQDIINHFTIHISYERKSEYFQAIVFYLPKFSFGLFQ